MPENFNTQLMKENIKKNKSVRKGNSQEMEKQNIMLIEHVTHEKQESSFTQMKCLLYI